MKLVTSTLLLMLFSTFIHANQNAQAAGLWDFLDRMSIEWNNRHKNRASLGPRPEYLVNDMKDTPLKRKLNQCKQGPFYQTDFSIGHRGAALQFPEHTKESYVAGAKMGAGILECDVTFTKDKALVCRHSQCDLHTTTNILATPLADECSERFSPASEGQPASAKCCTSDITLAQFKTLCGKMDAFDANAQTVQEYLGGTANYRTDLYATCGTLMTHAESIELFKSLGAKFTPELKAPSVSMPFEGEFSQSDYAQKMIDEYKMAGIPAEDVFPQSFNLNDVKYWIDQEPEFGQQAVYLDNRMYKDEHFVPTLEDMVAIKSTGTNIIAPPMWALLTLDANENIVPSQYALYAKQAGLKIITWTLERSMPLANNGDWYFQTVDDAVDRDGDVMEMLHVLAKDVGVMGVFSDWSATVTYYANCMM